MLHKDTFDYLKPTDKQMKDMTLMRSAAHDYATLIGQIVPDGPDKTYMLRQLREVAMWVNIAITREANGAPKKDD